MKTNLLISLGKKPRKGIIKVCRTCGEDFYAMPGQIKGKNNKISCSSWCQRKFKRTKLDSLVGELWEEIADEGLSISSFGRVCDRDGYIIKASKVRGYLNIRIKNKNFRVHRMVAKAFIVNSANKPQVNHIGGNKHNNNVDNLEWCTSLENIKHAFDTGLIDRSKCKKNSPLTADIVKEIRDIKRRIPDITNTLLAKKFNVTQPCICKILSNKRWHSDQHQS
jgi:hypothetical protein